MINKNNASDTFYDVNKEDIAIRTKKIKEDIVSLHKVSIEKPAFDSSVARFSSTKEASAQSEKKVDPKNVTPSYERDQINYELFKPYR